MLASGDWSESSEEEEEEDEENEEQQASVTLGQLKGKSKQLSGDLKQRSGDLKQMSGDALQIGAKLSGDALQIGSVVGKKVILDNMSRERAKAANIERNKKKRKNAKKLQRQKDQATRLEMQHKFLAKQERDALKVKEKAFKSKGGMSNVSAETLEVVNKGKSSTVEEIKELQKGRFVDQNGTVHEGLADMGRKGGQAEKEAARARIKGKGRKGGRDETRMPEIQSAKPRNGKLVVGKSGKKYYK